MSTIPESTVNVDSCDPPPMASTGDIPSCDADVIRFQFTHRQRKAYRVRLMEKRPFCRFCGAFLKAQNSTLDHLVPISQDGLDEPGNLELCCSVCNGCKGARTIEQWIDDIRFGAVPKSEKVPHHPPEPDVSVLAFPESVEA